MAISHYKPTPEQMEFFTRYPVPDDMVRRIAKRYGYTNNTVKAWLRPSGVRMNQDVFEAIVRDFLRPLYPGLDPDYFELTKETLATRRYRHRVDEQPLLPQVVLTRPDAEVIHLPAPTDDEDDDVEPDPTINQFIQAFASFDVLRIALGMAVLTAEQRLTLIALLADSS